MKGCQIKAEAGEFEGKICVSGFLELPGVRLGLVLCVGSDRFGKFSLEQTVDVDHQVDPQGEGAVDDGHGIPEIFDRLPKVQKA